jgi:hypothetical protein
VVVICHHAATRQHIAVEILLLRHQRDPFTLEIPLEVIVFERKGHARPQRIEQAVPVVRDVHLRTEDRRDLLGDRTSAGADPDIDAREARVFHRAPEVRERRAVSHTVDVDVFIEIEGAGGVLDEEGQRAAGSIDREEERAATAAVGIVLGDAGAETTGRGIR